MIASPPQGPTSVVMGPQCNGQMPSPVDGDPTQLVTHLVPQLMSGEESLPSSPYQLQLPHHNQQHPTMHSQGPFYQHQVQSQQVPEHLISNQIHSQNSTHSEQSTHNLDQLQNLRHTPISHPALYHITNPYHPPPPTQYHFEHYSPQQHLVHQSQPHQIVVQNQQNNINIQQTLPIQSHSQCQMQAVPQMPALKHHEHIQHRQHETRDNIFKIMEHPDPIVEVHPLHHSLEHVKQQTEQQIHSPLQQEEAEHKVSIVYEPNQFQYSGEPPHTIQTRIHVSNVPQQYIHQQSHQQHSDSSFSNSINGLKSYTSPCPFKVPLSHLCSLGPMLSGCPAIVI